MPMPWLARLLGRRAKIEAQNEAALARHHGEVTRWRTRKDQYDREAKEWTRIIDAGRSGEQSAMETLLEAALSDIAWPKETEVNFDFGNDSTTLDVDLGLPDENDMPRKVASVASRGIKVQIKERSDAQTRRDFARLAQAALFRVTGEAFTALPTLQEVTVSGYVQRPDARTGQVVDEYVLSARVPRDLWEQIDFGRLEAIDPAAALERFQLVRSMERGGRLRAIKPLQS